MPKGKADLAGVGELQRTLSASCADDCRLWDDLVNASPAPDTYFRPGYALAYADEGATAVAALLYTSTRRFLIPLLLRKISELPFAAGEEGYDAQTPYGYGGVAPLDPGDISASEAAELIRKLREWLLNANAVSCMLRLHPLLTQDGAFGSPCIEAAGGILRRYGPTRAIDLTLWDENLNAPAGMNSNRRRNLGFARRNLSVVLAPCNTFEGRKLMEKFRGIYEETMRRVSASSYYFFPDEYYSALIKGLGGNLAVAIASRDRDAVSGALFFADARFAHYHLGGATAEGQRHKAHTMVMVAGAEWARGRGCRWLHLGGGRTPDDSLYEFKRSFGGATFFYSFVTVIADHARYDELVRLRNSTPAAGPPHGDFFFPEYRA